MQSIENPKTAAPHKLHHGLILESFDQPIEKSDVSFYHMQSHSGSERTYPSKRD